MLLGLVVSLLLILFLIYRVGPSNLIDSVSQVDGALFVIACLLALPIYIVKSFRWSRILNAQKIRLSLPNAVQYVLIGLYAAVLTPGKIGDLLRPYLVSRTEKKSFGFITASVVFDRILDLGMMVVIATLGVLFIFTPEQWETMSSTVILLVVVAILGVLLVYMVFSIDFGKYFLSKLGTVLIGRLPKKYATNIDLNNELNDFFKAIELYRTNYTDIVSAAVCSVAAWIIYGFQGYILFLAFEGSHNVSVWIIIFLVAFTAFTTLIPFTISGIGVRETIFIAFLGTIGIAEAEALSFSLLLYTISTWIPAIFGGILLSKKGTPRRDKIKKHE